MKPKRIVMGAALVGCFAAAMISGASAEKPDNISGHANARAGGNHIATGQLNGAPRQGGSHYTNAGRMGEASARDNRVFAEGRAVGGEQRFARVGSETRYGWRGDRGGDRSGGVGAAADGYSYGRRPLYAYAPGYSVGPYYDYAAGYDIAYSAVPYYDSAPGFSVGVGIGPVGIGIGPAWRWW